MSPTTPHDNTGERELAVLLRGLDPLRHDGVYRFATLPADTDFDLSRAVCVLREPEGMSILAAEGDMPAQARVSDYRACWITLRVRSSLAAVGLTAAVANALADADISCNVVAGMYHDHLFVACEQAARTMDILLRMQRQAATPD